MTSANEQAGRRRGGKGRSASNTEDATEIVNSLRRLFKAIHEYSKATLRRTGLSGPQVWALTVLAKEPGLSLGELSQRLFAHPSTVSGIIDRLVRRDAVSRTVSREDRREVSLSLTSAGRRILSRSPLPVQEELRQVLAGMPAARLRALRQSLDAIVRSTTARRMSAPFFVVDAPRTKQVLPDPRARDRQPRASARRASDAGAARR